MELDAETSNRAGAAVDLARGASVALDPGFYRALIDTICDAVVVIDATGRIAFASPSVERVLGYPATQLVSLCAYDFLSLDEASGARSRVAAWLCGSGQRCHWVVSARHRDGTWRWLEGTGSDLRADPAVVGIVLSFRDVTDRKADEAQVVQARQGAEHASRMKTSFLADMSHEMRTPLGAIIGFAELLRTQVLTQTERDRYLAIIGRNGHQLTRLINDILDLARVESGRLELERLAVSLPELLVEVTSSLDRQAQDKGLKLTLRIEGQVPETIATDPTRLRQILLNLLGNAVKFTAHGEVTLTVQRSAAASAGGPAQIGFLVRDTGPGIDPAVQQRLFQPFSQADASMARRFGGSGLGLALARRLAQLLGGDVVLVASRPGAGTTFLATVAVGDPANQASAVCQAPAEAGERALTGLRVLLVEDSEDNSLLISSVLATAGARVEAARNGAEGVEKALQGDHDVVVMDLQMPGVDGLRATVMLRSRGFRKPIIALTARVMPEDHELSKGAGCDAHLTKPVDQWKLICVVAHHARASGGRGEPVAALPSTARS